MKTRLSNIWPVQPLSRALVAGQAGRHWHQQLASQIKMAQISRPLAPEVTQNLVPKLALCADTPYGQTLADLTAALSGLDPEPETDNSSTVSKRPVYSRSSGGGRSAARLYLQPRSRHKRSQLAPQAYQNEALQAARSHPTQAPASLLTRWAKEQTLPNQPFASNRSGRRAAFSPGMNTIEVATSLPGFTSVADWRSEIAERAADLLSTAGTPPTQRLDHSQGSQVNPKSVDPSTTWGLNLDGKTTSQQQLRRWASGSKTGSKQPSTFPSLSESFPQNQLLPELQTGSSPGATLPSGSEVISHNQPAAGHEAITSWDLEANSKSGNGLSSDNGLVPTSGEATSRSMDPQTSGTAHESWPMPSLLDQVTRRRRPQEAADSLTLPASGVEFPGRQRPSLSSDPEELEDLATKIQQILDEEARRYGIDV
jgi:hypothetical protein